jgi:hypothetical protein
VKYIAICQTLYRVYLTVLGFDAQHETGTDQPAIKGHAAGTAVPGAAAFFRASKPKPVTQHFEQGLVRLTDKLSLIAIDDGRYKCS